MNIHIKDGMQAAYDAMVLLEMCIIAANELQEPSIDTAVALEGSLRVVKQRVEHCHQALDLLSGEAQS